MPFTHFHLGPALLIGVLALRYLDLPTFISANLIVDWRAALVFLGFWPPPRHSWVHTYLGGFLMAFLLAGTMILIRPYLQPVMRKIELEQTVSKAKISAAALSGVIIHVTLDAFHHPTMHPFYPLMEKPLYGLFSTVEVRLIALSCMLLAVPVYILHVSDFKPLFNP